jgi:ribosomal protein S18 acetylase RimI-like enzyme
VGAVRILWADEDVWGAAGLDGAAGYVHTLVIDRAYAGGGMGLAILRSAERIVAASGRALLRLDCIEGNSALQRYYTSAGYAERGTVTTAWGGARRFERSLSHLLAGETPG